MAKEGVGEASTPGVRGPGRAVEAYHRVWYSREPGTALPRPGLWGRKGPTDATAAGSGEDYLF